MKLKFIFTLLVYSLIFLKPIFAQEINFPSPQSGSELSWNKHTLVYFNRNLDIKNETVDPKMIVFDFNSRKSISVAEDPKILTVLAFDNNIVSVMIDGRLKGYLKDGSKLIELKLNRLASSYLSVCKILEDGVFAILSLSQENDQERGKYEVLVVRIIDSEFRVVKQIPVLESGRLVYRNENLWLIGKNDAIKLNWKID
jgi:hypothetical protein